MDAENIAEKARRSISSFCINECKSYCCRKGYLLLEKSQVPIVTQGSQDELIQKGEMKQLPNGKFSLRLEEGCPSLKDFKCTIYTNQQRPKTCANFPLYLEGKTFRLSQRCTAVKAGMLFPYIHMLRRLGLTQLPDNPYATLETQAIDLPKDVQHQKQEKGQHKGTVQKPVIHNILR